MPAPIETTHDHPLRWLLAICLITIVLWGAGAFGFFRAFNHFFYDTFAQWSPIQRKQPVQVLLLEGEAKHLETSGEAWSNLLESLRSLGAKQIVFLFFPRHAGYYFSDMIANWPHLWFARQIVVGATRYRALSLEPLPPWVKNTPEIQTGIMVSGLPVHQQNRFQLFNLVLENEQSVTAIEAAITKQKDQSGANHYRINFNGGIEHLPRIRLERALEGGLVESLVKDRTVIIGLRGEHAGTGVIVPTVSADHALTHLEFHAMSLDTLLSERVIRESSEQIRLLVLFLITIITTLSCRWLSIQMIYWLALGTFLVNSLIIWGLVAFFHLWFPFMEVLLAEFITVAFVIHQKNRTEALFLSSMVRTLATEVQERFSPPGFFESDEHWTQIITMVGQTLHLKRIIFLERVPGDHRVKEVKALYCSLEDINEMRRDYERAPYSDAIEQNGLVRVTFRNYFKDTGGPEERQWLYPLIFTGEVMGFWAFTTDGSEDKDLSGFEKAVEDFGLQITELLYQRQSWRERNQAPGNILLRWWSRETGEQAQMNSLHKSITFIERRLGGLEDVFNGLETGAILYNLFGNVLHVNRRMTELAKTIDLSPFELSALDFIVKLCEQDATEVRTILRQTILEHQPTVLPVTTFSDSGKNFVLQIRPLGGSGEDGEEEEGGAAYTDVVLFQMKGILIELVDITVMKSFYKLKEQVMDRVFCQMRDDLSTVVMAGYLLNRKQRIHAEQERSVGKLLNEKMGRMVHTLEQAQIQLARDVDVESITHYPVDGRTPILRAVNGLEKKAQDRLVNFDVHVPKVMALVHAAPDQFFDVLHAILSLLVNDAAEETVVVVEVKESDGHITYRFSNTGFGMPNDRFQEYLFGSGELVSTEFKQLRWAWRVVRNWQGNLTASSEMGEGIRVTLTLDAFLSQH
ncbi:hypothetical protein ACQZV8_05790 [Magnetococcales bacterium HHB-1]